MRDSEGLPLIVKLYRELSFVYAVAAIVGFIVAVALSSDAPFWSAAVWILSSAIAGMSWWTNRLSVKFSNRITKGVTP